MAAALRSSTPIAPLDEDDDTGTTGCKGVGDDRSSLNFFCCAPIAQLLFTNAAAAADDEETDSPKPEEAEAFFFAKAFNAFWVDNCGCIVDDDGDDDKGVVEWASCV